MPSPVPVKMDLKQVEQLAALQCTDEEIAAWFGVNPKTVQRRKRNAAFAAALERGRLKGKMSVRRRLFAIMNGPEARPAAAAGIFLAKNLLGYRDTLPIELTGKNGGPVEVHPDVSKLSDEELRTIAALGLKATAGAAGDSSSGAGKKKSL